MTDTTRNTYEPDFMQQQKPRDARAQQQAAAMPSDLSPWTAHPQQFVRLTGCNGQDKKAA